MAILHRVFRNTIFRSTLSYLIGVSVAVFVVLAIVYASLALGYFRDLNSLIAEETRLLEARYGAAGVSGVSAGIGDRIQSPSFPRLFYLLVDANGAKIAGNLAHWPERLGPVEDWMGAGGTFRQWTAPVPGYDFVGATATFPGGERLLVARHYQDIAEYLRLTLTVLIQATIATIVIGSIGALWLGLLIERRIATINRSIATILSGDLGQRIPVARAADDDFARLIRNLNHMLDRIAQLMEGVKQLSDNIAHDLRTPLTRLRNGLSSIELDELGVQRETVAGLLEEADGLLATFNALLRIAQIESGNRRAAFAPTDMVTILRDVCEFYEPLAAERAQHVETAFPTSCAGVFDRDLLFQACANLLDNAIKYSPDGGTIRVGLRELDGDVQLTVADSGPGIPPSERDKVFQRFYRVEASRGLRPGNGLGLSLVQAVVALHGGSVSLGDNDPGLLVVVRLPRSTAPARE
jgi:signal transduction histidine kinase